MHLQNVPISVGARRHHFDGRIRIPFLCACDDESCHEFVILALGAFDEHSKRRLVLVAPGHTVEQGVHAGEGDGYELYTVDGQPGAAGSKRVEGARLDALDGSTARVEP